MKWSFVIPSQPPSVKHTYRIVRYAGRYGLAKAKSVENYQLVVKALAHKARPPEWRPGERVRVRLWFHVGPWIDSDNAISAIFDGLKWALDIDDRIFLPCVEELTVGNKQPEVIVEVE